ncbi:MAG: bifunctional nuclease family protein [Acidobacteriota bacterium]
MSDKIEVKLMGLILDPVSKTPVMILKPENRDKVIPIWIGINEANTITMELENIVPPRPMTQDLIRRIISRLKYKVDKVVINEIVDNTYYAELYIKNREKIEIFDCRPSDAVAIAIKNKSKIYISEQVYSNFNLTGIAPDILYNENKIEKWFNSLNSKDFGEIEQ